VSDKNKNIKLDIKGFQNVLKALKRITGASYEDIMKSQTRIILEKAARGTKQAKIKDIISRNMPLGTKFPRYSATGSSKMKKHNGKLYWMPNKIPADVWFPILERAKATTARKMKHRGISKGQFSAWAKNLRMNIKNTKEAKKLASFLINKGMSKASKKGKNKDIVFELVSYVKAGGISNAHFALAGAMHRRINHFNNALRNGVFKDVKEIKKQFGIG
jgi:hypothetical protein